MQVRSLTYSEHLEDARAWTLEKSSFGSINLMVGRNASGKTRFINVLNGISTIIGGKNKQLFESGSYDVIFADGKHRYRYILRLEGRKISRETLSLNSKELLDRDSSGAGFIWGEALKTSIEFKIQPTDVVAVVRRDSIQHPFLEPLHQWASSIRRYAFGSELGQKSIYAYNIDAAENTTSEARYPPSTEPEKVIELYVAGFKNFSHRFDEMILADLKRIGYDCEEVGADPFPDLRLPNAIPIMMHVKERSLPGRTRQFEMSMGMYRVLALLVNLNYSILTEQASCVLIDDIGEGLDFERSSQLIKLVIEKCRRHKFQLFMTTNDRFVMNDVDLKYWHIVERDSNVVRMIDFRQSRKRFEEFRFLGLNNFDFFASKAYLRKPDDEENSDIR